MSWSIGKPLDRATPDDRATMTFLREIYTRTKFGSFTWNPPNVPANSTVDTTLSTTDAPEIVGLRAGMRIGVTPPSTIDSGLAWGALVTADDTLTIRLANVTALGINPASGTWAFSGMVL